MSTSPLILGIETATLAGSISIASGDRILATFRGDPTISHSNTLLADIDELLSQQGLAIQDIDLFAAASGPGSFTGLRIGIATAKALAATLKRPCLGIPTLEAIAYLARPAERIVSLLPAGRGELFVEMFSVTASGEITESDEPAHLPPKQAIGKYLKHSDICWTGDGANAYATMIQDFADRAGYRFVNAAEPGVSDDCWRIVAPSSSLAESVSLLAARKFGNGQSQTPITLQALYVRPSDAEIKL